MENSKQQLKKVKDISYAGVLKLSKYRIKEVLWEGGKAWFVFIVDEKANETLTSFINGDLMGNIKEYSDSIDDLKKLIFSNK